jgi:hypothetical protein
VAEVNRADQMLGALEAADGAWLARHDIFDHCGVFFLTNNAATELRDRGFNVEHRVFQCNHEYRLERGVGDPAVTGYASSPTSSHQLGDPVRPSHKLAEPTLPAAGEKTGVEANAGELTYPSAPQEFLSPEEESARPAVPPPIRPLAGQLSIEDAA